MGQKCLKVFKRLKRERSFKNCFSLFKKNIKITGIRTTKKRDPHKPPPGGKERKDKSIEKLGAEDGQRSGDSVLGLVLQIREFAERSYRFQLLVVGLFFCGSRLFATFERSAEKPVVERVLALWTNSGRILDNHACS